MALTSDQWSQYFNLAYEARKTTPNEWGGYNVALPQIQALQAFDKQYNIANETWRGGYYSYGENTLRDQFDLGPRAVNKVFDNPSKVYTSLDEYTKDFTSYRQVPVYGKTSIWDSIFHPFGNNISLTDFLNPITGTKALTQVNDSFGGGGFIDNILKPAPVNYSNELFKGTTNVVGSVGIGLGIEGATQAATSYVSATTPLAEGVQGPVNPGFWSTLSHGDVVGAWDMVAAPVSSAIHAPSTDTGFTSLAKGTAIGQIVNEFVQLTGKIGRGLIDLVSGNVAGVVRDFGKAPSPLSNTGPVLSNPFGSYGGGGGGGLGVGAANSGQSQTNPLLFPLMGIAVVVVVWLLVRKK